MALGDRYNWEVTEKKVLECDRILKALGHDIRADCLASGCGFTTCAYALIENDAGNPLLT